MMSSATFVCGIDFHKSSSTICVINSLTGQVVMLVEVKHTGSLVFIECLSQYKENLIIGVESTYNWYWLVDLLQEQGFNVMLGDAEAIGNQCRRKNKSDAGDAEKIARLLTSGLFPESHICNQQFRSIRDLHRGICSLQQFRSDLVRQSKTVDHQHFLSGVGSSEESTQMLAESRKILIASCETQIKNLNSHLQCELKNYRESELDLLQTIPGIGEMLASALILEIEHVDRFQSVRNFSSYCGFVPPSRVSAGKNYGDKGKNKCNGRLRQTFQIAAICFIRYSKTGRTYNEKIKRQHSSKASKNIIAHKIARTVYYMLRNNKEFDVIRFA